MQPVSVRKSVRFLALTLVMILCLQVFLPAEASAASYGSQTEVQRALDSIANGSWSIDSSTTMAVGKTFKGTRANEQCKGYAKNVFIMLWGVNPGSTREKPSNYLLYNPNSVKKVGSVTNMTQSNIASLFSGARAGDFVQIRRHHTGSHSAIVYAVSSSGVTFLEANTDNKNTIMLNTHSWKDLCDDNQAMTVYTYSGYSASSGYTGSGSGSGSSASSGCFPKCSSSCTTITAGLKNIGVDSSYSYRKQIAAANNISGYTGSAFQNTQMLLLLKAGNLLKPGASGSSSSGSSGESSGGSSGTAAKSSASVADVENLLFDAGFYASLYSDLRNAFGSNASALKNHWLSCGINEGRVASPFFDAKWYMANNPDVARAYGSTNWAGAYSHFTHHGFNEGRQGSPYFSAVYYLNKYSDLKAAFGSNYLAAARHFLSNGLAEGRQASAQFSISVYNRYNADVVRAFSNPLYRIGHYITYVQYGSEKRRCV